MKKTVNAEAGQYNYSYEYEFDENKEKKKLPLTHKMFAKIIAFILVILMSLTTVVSGFAIGYFADWGIYSTSKEECFKVQFSDQAETISEQVLDCLTKDSESFAVYVCSDTFAVRYTHRGTESVFWECGTISENGFTALTYTYNTEPFTAVKFKNYDKTIDLTAEISLQGNYIPLYYKLTIAYALKYWIFIILLASLFLAIASFIFLMCSAGYKKGYEKAQAGWGTSTPLDFLAFGVAVICAFMFAVLSSLNVSDLLLIIFSVVACIIGLVLVLGWLMSLAVRVKLGKWWENTVIYRLLMLLLKTIKVLLKWLKKACKACLKFVGNIPLVWKTAVGFAVVSFVNLIFMYCNWGEFDNLIVYWFFSTLIVGAVIVLFAVILKHLQIAGEKLAEGDLAYQVNTEKLFGDFKKHGDSLNNIAKGMSFAVEQRMRSERMKTELITNVSHDIKTPLTSIINYTDLISKEPCNNEKITEYSKVLLRQSENLKRLIEDLVEASKASTGNLEVNLAPCDVNIFLTQVVGEYEEKLSNKNLQLITAYCEIPVQILADGRRLWRVFDNLMNNVCKYAQSGTRVYLSLEQKGKEAVLTLKNTSHLALNVSPDELMERFVRGDASRNTEGNGLGLSIAKSLTELQNGILNLSIDGDLFKVTLCFPII